MTELGKVTGTFSTFVVNGVDAQGDPILIYPSGIIIFRMNVEKVVDHSSGRPIIRVSTPIAAVVVDGKLETPGRQDGGVYLVPNDSPTMEPTNTKYLVEYKLVMPDTRPIEIEAHEIFVAAGQEIDLGMVIPPDGAPPISIAAAEAAAARAAESARLAQLAAEAAAQGGTGGGISMNQLNMAILTHVEDDEPHPAYDDIPDLTMFYAARKAAQ